MCALKTSSSAKEKEEESSKVSKVAWDPNYTKNEHLYKLQSDHLYHLALDTSTHDLEDMFGDVQFVCVGGTVTRMKNFATLVGKELGIKLPTGVTLEDMTRNAHRYSMFKMGPVLSVTHGMGAPSLSILLHELFKLVTYAKCRNVTFLRLGTSGGLGIPPGSLVVTNSAIDGFHRRHFEQAILGQVVQRPAEFDSKLVQELMTLSKESFSSDFETFQGCTMCTNDFYEGQGRLDGAFCTYSQGQKVEYLQNLRSKFNVINIEMESMTFGAMCTQANIPGGIICVTLLDRLIGDQVLLTADQYSEFQERPQKLAAAFIASRLSRPA